MLGGKAFGYGCGADECFYAWAFQLPASSAFPTLPVCLPYRTFEGESGGVYL